MHLLVTGGAGYIGAHAVRRLRRAGHRVTVYDNLEGGHCAAVGDAELVVGDLHDTPLLREVMADRGVEAVMHFAAYALVGESVTDPARYFRNNVGGSFSLLEAMRAADVRRIVFSSTTAVYGEPERLPITEDESLKPINPYGYTKMVVEQMLSDYAAAYGWGCAALRYFNAAGADPSGEIGEDHDPETHLIPLVLQVALGQREEILIFGDDWPTPDGTCIRDYIHVCDLAEAHVRALERLAPGSIHKLNLGTGQGCSVLEIVEACRRVTGHPIPARITPRRPGDPARLVADASLAQRVLQWTPEYTEIERTVETAWNWSRQHPHGYL